MYGLPFPVRLFPEKELWHLSKLGALLAFIHRSAWNACSWKFAGTAFSEVRRRSILGTSHQTSGGGIMLVVEKDAPLQLMREEGTAA
jgi:hypothetical protein